MSWQFLITLHVLFATGTVFAKRALARHPAARRAPLAIAAVSTVAVALTGLLLAPWLGVISQAAGRQYVWQLLGGGLLFMATTTFSYLTFVYLESVVASILNTLCVVMTLVLAWCWLGEQVTWLQVIGSTILLPAICYLIYTMRLHERRQGNRWLIGCLFALATAVTYALAATNENYLVRHMGVPSYLVWGWSYQAVTALAVALIRPRQFSVCFRPVVREKLGWLCVTAAASGACFVLAQGYDTNVGILTMLSNCRLILVALLAGRVLNERQDYKRRIGIAAASVIGVTCLLWR